MNRDIQCNRNMKWEWGILLGNLESWSSLTSRSWLNCDTFLKSSPTLCPRPTDSWNLPAFPYLTLYFFSALVTIWKYIFICLLACLFLPLDCEFMSVGILSGLLLFAQSHYTQIIVCDNQTFVERMTDWMNEWWVLEIQLACTEARGLSLYFIYLFCIFVTI